MSEAGPRITREMHPHPTPEKGAASFSGEKGLSARSPACSPRSDPITLHHWPPSRQEFRVGLLEKRAGCYYPRMLAPAVATALVILVTAPPSGARDVDPPATTNAIAPRITVIDDVATLTWLEPGRLRTARLDGDAWSTSVTIVERDDFFANWADTPALARGADGVLIAHWLQKSGPGTYSYDVVAARSADDGSTWTTLGTVHRDGTKTEHGFVSMVPEDGGVRVFWLDGRAMASADDHPDDDDHGSGSMTLRTALIGSAIGATALLDDRVCECCNTAAAVTSVGPIIAYRDRGTDETRDISVVRRVGDVWSSPRTVHADGWKIEGCPVNGPALAARGDRVAVAWFTGAGNRGTVRVAFSDDAGATFGSPVTVDDTQPVGRVGIVMPATGVAIVSWIDIGEEAAVIRLRVVAPDGRMGLTLDAAETSIARASGFPCLAAVGDDLLLVWTDAERHRLRGKRLPISAVPAPPSSG